MYMPVDIEGAAAAAEPYSAASKSGCDPQLADVEVSSDEVASEGIEGAAPPSKLPAAAAMSVGEDTSIDDDKEVIDIAHPPPTAP